MNPRATRVWLILKKSLILKNNKKHSKLKVFLNNLLTSCKLYRNIGFVRTSHLQTF